MNYDQFTGIIRAVVPAIVAWLASSWSSTTQGLVVTAVAAIAAALWSIFNNQTGKTIA